MSSSVNVMVGAGPTSKAPTVTMNSVTGGPFTAPATVPLSATANDSDGSVTQVQFFNGTTLIGTSASTSNPYTFTWTNVGAGTYSVTAVATDNQTATTTSAAVLVTVNLPTGGGTPAAAFVKTDGTT